MKFKTWLKIQENGTGTNAVAIFARPVGIGTTSKSDDDNKKKKDKKKD